MPAAVETMMSVREIPWHGLGTVVDEQLTASDALREAGLDWAVEKLPIQLVGGDTIPGKYATTRMSDKKVLGVVGEQYTPLQNKDAFAFADALVDDGSAKYETAGALRDGRWIWMMMRIPESVMIAGEDPVDTYLMLMNSHDGTTGITAAVTPVRVVCMNTLNLALNTTTRKWSVRHVGTMDSRLSEARRSLELTFSYMEDFGEKMGQLAETRISDESFERIVGQLTDVEKVADDIVTNYKTSATIEGFRGTQWGALNAIGEYYDWARKPRTDNARLTGSLFGAGRNARDAAYELMTA